MPQKSTLVSRLKAQFDADPALEAKCIRSSKRVIADKGTANRAFDVFPPLVPDKDRDSLLQEYQRLLQGSTRKTVRAFEKRIIEMACRELLDDYGNIQKELIDLLDWKESTANIDNYTAICAFVGMMNIYLTTHASASLLQAKQHNYLAMTRLIDNSYGQWVREYMRANKIAYNREYDAYSFKVKDTHPLLFVSLFAGGIVGLGVYTAAKVGQELYNEHKPLMLPEAPTL